MLGMLNSIDIYGSSFNFTTFKNKKFNTKIGGIFTILTFGLSLALFLVFGKPVWMKLNPSVIIQTTDLSYYPQYQVQTPKFPIAFRFENEKRQIADLGAYMFPYLQYIKLVHNDTTGNYDTASSTVVDTVPCTEDVLQSGTLANTLKGWNCVDFSKFNYTIGGGFDSGNKNVTYFKITVFYCKYDGLTYSNCTDYDTLNSLLNAKVKIYMSVMVPDVAITPQDPETPLSVVATNLFFTLNPLLMRTDRYYYRYVTVKQDLGWFFEDYTYYDGYTMERRDTDIQMRTIDDYKNPNTIKTIATAVFFTNNKINEYQVNFTKIQNVLANTGGIINLFTTLFAIINFYLCDHLMYFYLVNDLFDFDVDQIKTRTAMKLWGLDKIITNKLQRDQLEKRELNESKESRTDRNKPDKYEVPLSTPPSSMNRLQNEITSKNNNALMKLNILNVKRVPFTPQKSEERERMELQTRRVPEDLQSVVSMPIGKLTKRTSVATNINTNLPSKNDKWRKSVYKDKFVKKKEGKYMLPLKIIIKKLFCSYDSSSLISRLYFYAEGLLKHRLDILYYLRNINKTQRFMEIFLEREQNQAMNYLRNTMIRPDDLKTKVDEKEELIRKHKMDHDYNEKEIIEVISYFKTKQNKSDLDYKIMGILDDNILDIIKNE
jgi:hypothetical protein